MGVITSKDLAREYERALDALDLQTKRVAYRDQMIAASRAALEAWAGAHAAYGMARSVGDRIHARDLYDRAAAMTRKVLD